MAKFYRYKDLLTELLRKEFRVRYKHLALGYFWSIASPLVYALLYYFVFKVILDTKTPNFPLFLTVGLFAWQWIGNSIGVGPMTFYGNAALIKKTLFPRYLIPVVVTLQDAIHFLLSVPIILCFMYFYGFFPTWHWLWALPLLLGVQFLLTYSFNLLIATLNLFFRDLERLVQLLMTFLFYMTPIVYSETLIPSEYQNFIFIHPFAPLIINWRNLVFNGTISIELFISSLLWGLGALLVSQSIYRKLQWRFAEIL